MKIGRCDTKTKRGKTNEVHDGHPKGKSDGRRDRGPSPGPDFEIFGTNTAERPGVGHKDRREAKRQETTMLL